MDPFAKYLPVAKAKIDLSNINTEDDLTKFCKEHLKKKGIPVDEQCYVPPSTSPTYSITRNQDQTRHIVTSTYAVDRIFLLAQSNNPKYVQLEIEKALYHGLSQEIVKLNIVERFEERDYIMDQIKYVARLGVFKP